MNYDDYRLMAPPVDDPEIVCEFCNRECTDDFVLFEWPGYIYAACLCPRCAAIETGRMKVELEFMLDELGEYVTNL